MNDTPFLTYHSRIKAKKITKDSAPQSNRGFQVPTSVEISVADLLELVKETYSDILSKDVAEHLGVERRNTKLGRSMKYSLSEEYEELDEAGVRKGVYGDKKSDKKGFNAKVNIGADGNYIELAENAKYDGTSSEQGKKINFTAMQKSGIIM